MTETQTLVPPDITEIDPQTVTKETIRKKVWEHFRTHKIALFPGPYERIPNFKGADLATEKLKELDIFQVAKFIEVNPDKPLEAARILVLESGKDLYVPVPKIEGCLFKKLELDGSVDVRRVVTRWGIDNTGRKVDVEDKIRIDLLVIGSVAVSKDGYRIGKGRGFADLEYALLKEMDAIDDNTVIVTLVHDSQVFDTLPTDLFKKYDVPVNYIVTPTNVIKIEHPLEKPTGVYWNMLTEKRVGTIEVLKKLKKKYESEGKDTTLATVEENPGPKHYFRYRRFFKKKPKVEKSSNEPKPQLPEIKLESVKTDEPKRKNSHRKKRSVKLYHDKITETQTVEASETSSSIVSKETIRKKVWDHFNSHKIALIPGPYKKIPNFKEAELATDKLRELEVFKNAKFVEVSPDKPLEDVRILVLESGKTLYVPSPNVEGCPFKKLDLDDTVDVRKVVTRWGMVNAGQKINIEDTIRIDLIIIGSVAVSKDGHRIGKGRGFADLEFALLKEMKAIDDDTVIVTLVHDSQVFETLPTDLFMKHDVPVDYIVTPTTVTKIIPVLPRPVGVYWDILTEKRVGAEEALKKLKEKHESEGRDTTLATVEDRKPTKYFNTEAKAKSKSKKSKPQLPLSKSATSKPRRDQKNIDKENNRNNANKENNENVPPPLKKKRKKYRKTHSDYSLHVSNIKRCVRVSELKTALVEKGIRPNNITWKGNRGYCFLHYAKNNRKSKEAAVEEPFAIDDVIEKIQQLNVNPDMKNLNVKVMERITRIETMNITAV